MPTPAATVLLVRDASAGLEVLLVERHRNVTFVGGATVFPGGKVDPCDGEAEAYQRCAGAAGLEPSAASLRVAAIREVFEETGLLLARPRGGSELLGAGRAAEIGRRHREALRARRVSIGGLAALEDLELAGDLLVPFAHWITPEPMPRRFDTHFFLVSAPPDQAALHDGSESVDSVWLSPRRALEEADGGRRTIIFPTRMNLSKLARSRRVAEALACARANPIVTVLPRLELRPEGAVVRIPAEAGYDVVEASVEELEGRKR